MSKQRSTSHHRPSKIQEIALEKMAVSGRIQRELKQHRVEHLLSDFDLDDFGLPVVSWRDGLYYIVDGQHRIEALKLWLGKGWEIQKIECRVHQGLSEAEEADMFLRLNDILIVGAFDKFKNGVTANRPTETAIAKVVADCKLVISKEQVPGAIGAVGTLVRVYTRTDGQVLGRALRIIRDAFGDSGFEAVVIDGIAHLCHRYNSKLDDDAAVTRLAETRGGVKGLLGKADVLHKQTGQSRAQCVAAAAIDIINSRSGGRGRLPSWWKMQANSGGVAVAP